MTLSHILKEDSRERIAARPKRPRLQLIEPSDRGSTRKVMYFVDHSFTQMEYAASHIMRPVRLQLTHSLVGSLGLDKRMTVCRASPASAQDLMTFHSPEYVHYLRMAGAIGDDRSRGCCPPHVDDDCPLFPSIWEVVQSQCGASIACADALRRGACDIAINWAGGMHHAWPTRASGFCYANDIVLCIRELLRSYCRVLYVDIDVHHGDAVDAAFRENPRVFTFSIHQHGNQFFPETGDLEESGSGPGLGFSLNIPLLSGSGDHIYRCFYTQGLAAVVEAFDPQAVVLQCGADTIAGDLIGNLRVSTHAHAECVNDVIHLGLPTVLLGGGGYNVLHTAKCWAVHTALATGVYRQLPHTIPRSDRFYKEYRQETPLQPPTVHVFAVKESRQGPTEAQVAAKLLAFLPHLTRQMMNVRRARGAFRPPEMPSPANGSGPEKENSPEGTE
jgi:histone deacetylase 1/2